MDKRVIFAVAGAGKTTHIINRLSLGKRSLIVTYTGNNYHHLRQRIIQKFGFFPNNITVLTYFTFLYSFCYKPFLHDQFRSKGINWDPPPLRIKSSVHRFYIDSSYRLYSNRIARLVQQEDVLDHIKSRLAKYFDSFYIDEVQDFGGHDFNLLKKLCCTDIEICLVGDFYQHTFDTSRDGPVNKSLYDDFEKYKLHFSRIGVIPDTETLSHSYRCTAQVCEFIQKNLGINIQSHKQALSQVSFVSDTEKITALFACVNTVKLFYKNHSKYPCYSDNWGKSKGQDHYVDVCVMLTATAMGAYQKNALHTISAESRNKLYVACTRANSSVFLIEEKAVKQYQLNKLEIRIN